MASVSDEDDIHEFILSVQRADEFIKEVSDGSSIYRDAIDQMSSGNYHISDIQPLIQQRYNKVTSIFLDEDNWPMSYSYYSCELTVPPAEEHSSITIHEECSFPEWFFFTKDVMIMWQKLNEMAKDKLAIVLRAAESVWQDVRYHNIHKQWMKRPAGTNPKAYSSLRYYVFTVIYYAAFWIGMIMLLVISMAFFMIDLDDIDPSVQNMESPLKQSPGLAVRPVPDFQTTLIRFQQGKPQSYKPYTDHIQAFLLQYENDQQVGENFIDCSKGRPPNTLDKVCRFDLNVLGDGCVWQKDYGYDEGQPCILFKLNRIFGWEPEQYTPSEVPSQIADRWRPTHIAVSCDGEFPQDLENIGNVTYIPEWGLPTYFFPYLNQEGYRSPLLMVKFNNPANGVAISILCKIWVKNVSHDSNAQIGVIRFQLLVD